MPSNSWLLIPSLVPLIEGTLKGGMKSHCNAIMMSHHNHHLALGLVLISQDLPLLFFIKYVDSVQRVKRFRRDRFVPIQFDPAVERTNLALRHQWIYTFDSIEASNRLKEREDGAAASTAECVGHCRSLWGGKGYPGGQAIGWKWGYIRIFMQSYDSEATRRRTGWYISVFVVLVLTWSMIHVVSFLTCL